MQHASEDWVTRSPGLRIEQDGGARLLILDRPQVLNALSSDLASALLAAIEGANTHVDTRSIVISGAGDRAFCAGADLKERQSMSAADKWAQSRALWRVNKALWDSPKAVIAAIHGWCLGGGFELALYCDLRVASEDALFGWPEMTLGAFPGAGAAVILPRIIGRARAKSMFFSARKIDAREALALGIVEQVVPCMELRDCALTLARQIEATSPLGLAAVKRVINDGADLPFDEAVALDQSLRQPLDESEDYAEGIRAHFEKRKPVFRGR